MILFKAIAHGAKVMLMSRRNLKEKVFEVEPGWLGSKYLKGFQAEADWEKRRQMVIGVRVGGSLTPTMGLLGLLPKLMLILVVLVAICWTSTMCANIWLMLGLRG
jgi:hypothetical protein